MVDLPGQGATPASGLTFRPDFASAISACSDWLQAQQSREENPIALFGVSGGGYFTALAAHDPRVTAWIASTPFLISLK